MGYINTATWRIRLNDQQTAKILAIATITVYSTEMYMGWVHSWVI